MDAGGLKAQPPQGLGAESFTRQHHRHHHYCLFFVHFMLKYEKYFSVKNKNKNRYKMASPIQYQGTYVRMCIIQRLCNGTDVPYLGRQSQADAEAQPLRAHMPT